MNKGTFCPLIKKKCVENKCSWYTQIRGTNPNTGQDVDEWACVVGLLPMLLIENSSQQRQTGAAVESMRNEMAKRDTVTLSMLSQFPVTPSVIAEVQPNNSYLPSPE
jgi:hypothetical protein